MKTAYLDGELCGVDEAGLPSFAQTQAATDGERGPCSSSITPSIFCISMARDTSGLPLIERKALLEPLVAGKPGLQFNGHVTGDGELILRARRASLGLRRRGLQDRRRALRAGKPRALAQSRNALNRQEFVVVGWSDPEGSRPHLGALLLGYYTDDGLATELRVAA